MLKERPRLTSRKANALAKRFEDKKYRDQFVASRARRFLAHQMRELRGDLSQSDFGKILDKPQSVVSRLEDPNYGKWSVQTLLEVASSTDRALIVQFVSFNEFLAFTDQEGRYEKPAPFTSFAGKPVPVAAAKVTYKGPSRLKIVTIGAQGMATGGSEKTGLKTETPNYPTGAFQPKLRPMDSLALQGFPS